MGGICQVSLLYWCDKGGVERRGGGGGGAILEKASKELLMSCALTVRMLRHKEGSTRNHFFLFF